MRLRLKKEILTKIEESGTLVGKIADLLDRHYTSMPYILKNNHPTLIQKDVLMIISMELEIPENELVEEIPNKKTRKVASPTTK